MNGFNGDKAYTILKSIAYPRMTGTAGGLKAAKVLRKHLQAAGAAAKFESFRIWTYENNDTVLEVLKPYRASYEAIASGLSVNTPPEGLECELCYAEDGSSQYLDGVKGKAVMLSGGAGYEKLDELIRRGAAAVFNVGQPNKAPFLGGTREVGRMKVGKLPMLNLRFEDALEMIKKKASRIRFKVACNNYEAEALNVIAEVRGTEQPDEAIICVGHYDTISQTVGGHDNAAGVAILVELARCIAQQPLKRTVRFALFTGEEMGLWGSRHYIQQHQGEMANIRLCINCDVAGPIIGTNRIEVGGPDSLRWYLECMSHELGFGCGAGTCAYSSDNIPFNAEGIPAVSFARFGGYVSEGHTNRDGIEDIDGEHLAVTGRFMLEFLHRVGNAVVFPFERKLSDEAKKNVDTYVERMKGEHYTPLGALKPLVAEKPVAKGKRTRKPRSK